MTTTALGPILEAMLRQGQPDAGVAARVFESPVGPLVAAATEEGLVFLEFGDEARLARQVLGLERHFGPTRAGSLPYLDQTERELAEYFAGRRLRFTVPLVVRGTDFQERVWRTLLSIPYGETRAYVEVAHQLNLKNGQRAVGLANGQNRIAIIIPCHRVIEKSGGLRGYGGGVWRKKFLLDLERRFVPDGALAGTPLGHRLPT
jgi:AraC family transcriptional regulator, regulatory protein of adaptative response / methylated-DNA-[protein]-cysteine methyltransferase